MSKYYIDSKVTVWLREYFDADSDEDAIDMAKEGDYLVNGHEYLDDTVEYLKDNNDEDYIMEVYKDDNIIYSHYEH